MSWLNNWLDKYIDRSDDSAPTENYRVTQQSRYDARLLRGAENDDGTFGTLYYQNAPLCVTVEPNWVNNAVGVSCIPAGVYKCSKHNGTKYKDVWILHDVPNRSAILIHAGNTEDNTEGCIIVGSEFGNLGGKAAVLGSNKALKKLRTILPDTFWLRIEDAVLNG